VTREDLNGTSLCRRGLPGFILAVALAAGSLGALEAWEIRSIGGRDYIRMSEVAAFYDLTAEDPTDPNVLKFSGRDRELIITRNSRVVSINGVNHWLAFPAVLEGGQVLISRLDLGKTLEPALRPQLIEGLTPVRTVVIDAGHGGRDKGAVGPYECEKNFALDVARRVRDKLKKAGIPVVLTRNSDVFVELQDRAAVAKRLPDSIFVSLHFNAANWNRDANGFEIFCVTPRGAPSTEYDELHERDMVAENGNEHDLHSFALANTIYHSMQGGMEMFDRGVKRARFAVLRLSTVPAVLIEGGFLTSPSDARKIASKGWRENYASAIARGILEYSRLAGKGIPPRQVAEYKNGVEPRKSPVVMGTPTPVPEVTLRDLPAEN
jgi:N-acetylmuramoyl-L-alanine amidase